MSIAILSNRNLAEKHGHTMDDMLDSEYLVHITRKRCNCPLCSLNECTLYKLQAMITRILFRSSPNPLCTDKTSGINPLSMESFEVEYTSLIAQDDLCRSIR